MQVPVRLSQRRKPFIAILKSHLFPLTLCVFLLSGGVSFGASLKVKDLRTENLRNPISVDARKPHFSWQLESEKRNILQKAYEVQVTLVTGKSEIVWSSGKVISDESSYVLYKGKPLQSNQKYLWRVRVWDNKGASSGWSAPSYFETGFFEGNDWKAKWIQPGYAEDPLVRRSPLFRKQISIGKKVKSAKVFITSHGLYEASINGKRIGDAYLTPGWTSYNKRLQYQVYDVTDMLKMGKNAIGAMLGSGWYRGRIAWNNAGNLYGKDISLLFQLELAYSDGSAETIVSDETWKCSTGSIVSSEIYDGETIDARENKEGWTSPDYDDTRWSGVKVISFPYNNLIATYNEPVKKHEVFTPVKIIVTPKGENVIDFGQNLVGWVVMKVKGNAGDKITLSHAEVLDKEGNFYTVNLRAAKAQNTYILKGGGDEVFEPHFTWQGFRFVKVEGYPGAIKPEDFEAVALYSDMEKTGSFTTSNPLVNQLQHNIQWGQRGNFLDVPTDCPQRDERLGWTGDAQVFFRTAAFNMGVNNFFSKWLKDVAADQLSNGSVPHVVPNVLRQDDSGSAGWADVSTIIPWGMYLAYGNKTVLEDQYSSMKGWVEYVRSQSRNDLWNTGNHFGDWLFYRPDDDLDGRAAVTDKHLIAQCFYANSIQLLINAAKVLNRADDVSSYSSLLQKVKDAFMREYVTANGRLVSGTQTAYVLALHFDMLPEDLRAQAARRLVDNIKSYNTQLTTGFLGTPYLCHVLTRFGYDGEAYNLLLQEKYPSWLYPVKMGATTIWERWDGQKPDGTFQNPSMNSFNHYSYGAIGDWMYRSMAGIDTYEDGPGYKHIRIKPHIGGGFTNVSASVATPYGQVKSGWKTMEGGIEMDVTVPPNATATIFVPAKGKASVLEDGKPVASSKELQVGGMEDGYLVIKAGSGNYHFSSRSL